MIDSKKIIDDIMEGVEAVNGMKKGALTPEQIKSIRGQWEHYFEELKKQKT